MPGFDVRAGACRCVQVAVLPVSSASHEQEPHVIWQRSRSSVLLGKVGLSECKSVPHASPCRPKILKRAEQSCEPIGLCSVQWHGGVYDTSPHSTVPSSCRGHLLCNSRALLIRFGMQVVSGNSDSEVTQNPHTPSHTLGWPSSPSHVLQKFSEHV
eukprot:SAG11_NODE_1044_length_6049_cov_4.050084_4_plen_156_part_00